MVTQTIEIQKADKLMTDANIPNTVRRPRLIRSQLMPIDIPRKILIGSLGDGRLKVISPIKVLFSKEAANFVAKAIDFNEFGFGDNQTEALSDLQRTIVELFLTLDENKGHLGKALQLLREKLNKYISLNMP
jgi:hypothetical protein